MPVIISLTGERDKDEPIMLGQKRKMFSRSSSSAALPAAAAAWAEPLPFMLAEPLAPSSPDGLCASATRADRRRVDRDRVDMMCVCRYVSSSSFASSVASSPGLVLATLSTRAAVDLVLLRGRQTIIEKRKKVKLAWQRRILPAGFGKRGLQN